MLVFYSLFFFVIYVINLCCITQIFIMNQVIINILVICTYIKFIFSSLFPWLVWFQNYGLVEPVNQCPVRFHDWSGLKTMGLGFCRGLLGLIGYFKGVSLTDMWRDNFKPPPPSFFLKGGGGVGRGISSRASYPFVLLYLYFLSSFYLHLLFYLFKIQFSIHENDYKVEQCTLVHFLILSCQNIWKEDKCTLSILMV